MNQINFKDSINQGKEGEFIFKEDFLNFLQIEYIDVTGCQKFQVLDTDFKAKIGMYEIKANYKDDEQLFIEEYTNFNKEFGPISLGWWYKSKADLFVFLSKKTRNMILLPFTEEIKKHYEQIKTDFKLRPNKITYHNGNKWQSAYRIIPLSKLHGFYAKYKKI